MAYITVKNNGQALRVVSTAEHWTTAALALVASGDDDVTDGVNITSDYTMHFSNTATTTDITISQLDGTVIATHLNLQVRPGVGPRVLNPVPDVYQSAGDDSHPGVWTMVTGALAETCPRVFAFTNGTVLASGTMTLTAINLKVGMTISSISYYSATTALSGGTNQWFALYSSSRALLAQTVDDTSTAWGSNSVKTLALTSGYTVVTPGLHYVGINVTASTPPTLRHLVPYVNINGLAPILSGASTTGLTTTAPASAAAITASSTLPWAYVS